MITGPRGCGKSHLAGALVQAARKHDPSFSTYVMNGQSNLKTAFPTHANLIVIDAADPLFASVSAFRRLEEFVDFCLQNLVSVVLTSASVPAHFSARMHSVFSPFVATAEIKTPSQALLLNYVISHLARCAAHNNRHHVTPID